jgi:hypothetical protein
MNAYSARMRAHNGDGRVRETGGGLFGVPAREREDTLTVARALEPGPNTRGGLGRVRVDLAHIRAEDAALERIGNDERWIGTWHTHPGAPDGTGIPSKNDLEFWACDCRELRLAGRSSPHYVGLILTPRWVRDNYTCEREASWVRPAVYAWHMRAVADDQFIVTPARVER